MDAWWSTWHSRGVGGLPPPLSSSPHSSSVALRGGRQADHLSRACARAPLVSRSLVRWIRGQPTGAPSGGPHALMVRASEGSLSSGPAGPRDGMASHSKTRPAVSHCQLLRIEVRFFFVPGREVPFGSCLRRPRRSSVPRRPCHVRVAARDPVLVRVAPQVSGGSPERSRLRSKPSPRHPSAKRGDGVLPGRAS